ncbi:MAG: TatD family hydrolase [Nanoarchaeota archaeon]|nr:TatD family hydrolase [Nanoarchaeota archaeon]
MKLIDVHAHLESSRFKKDLDEVVNRFKDKGGKLIITSGVNPVTNRQALEISKKYDLVECSFGLYPIDAVATKFDNLADDYLRKIPVFDVDEELNWIREHADECVAIGEIGLDFKVVKDLNNIDDIKKEQEKVFRKVLELAKELGKTVVIHSRGAEERCIEILEEVGFSSAPKGTPPAQMASADADKVGVIMHCFNGKKALIRRCIDNGWSFSVPPVIARLNHFKMLVEMVPLEQLLTETDAPYLSPVAGERNESSNVEVTLEIIADIKNLVKNDVAGQIFINAEKLFNL